MLFGPDMKKILILIGAAAMSTFSLTSCATSKAKCCGSDGACCAGAVEHSHK